MMGVIGGLAGSLASARAVNALPCRVSATDPATIAMAAAVIGTVAIVAGCLPARKAARIDPTAALREE
jgi:putative ABC transport system permease protein